jgi:hypothetical protein
VSLKSHRIGYFSKRTKLVVLADHTQLEIGDPGQRVVVDWVPVDILPVPRGAQQFVHVGLEGRVAPGLDLPDHLAEPGFGNVRVEAGRGEGRTQLDPAFDPLESFCLLRREGPIAPAAMGASRFDPLVVTP